MSAAANIQFKKSIAQRLCFFPQRTHPFSASSHWSTLSFTAGGKEHCSFAGSFKQRNNFQSSIFVFHYMI